METEKGAHSVKDLPCDCLGRSHDCTEEGLQKHSQRASCLQKAYKDITTMQSVLISSSLVLVTVMINSHLIIPMCKTQQWSLCSTRNAWLLSAQGLMLAESIFPLPASLSKGHPQGTSSSQTAEEPGLLRFPTRFLSPHRMPFFILLFELLSW